MSNDEHKKQTALEVAIAHAKIERDGISQALSATCHEIDRLTVVVLEHLKLRPRKALRLVSR